jgi:SAM-dependent methyltransferase
VIGSARLMNPVEAHYDRYAEREWERLERHRTEFAVTCRVLAEFLPSPPGRVFDVGGGPGRYALHLIQLGYHVTLLDLSRRSLDLAIEKATAAGVYLPTPIQGDAVALPDRAPDATENYDGLFDAVLLMGPLYHLLAAEDRAAAVSEAYRVLRPGGLVFASFITRYAPLRDIAIRSPRWILDHPDRYQSILAHGRNPAHEESAFPDAYFAHPDEIVPLMTGGGFRLEALQGCEGLLGGHEETVNAIDDEELWAAWVELNYTLGREPALRGAADHLLYVGSKPVPTLTPRPSSARLPSTTE